MKTTLKTFDDGRSHLRIDGKSHSIRMVAPVMGDKPAPWNEDRRWTGYHWIVTVKYQTRQYTLDFWTGSLAGEPNVEDVVDCLLSDAASYEDARDFEDWCGDFGYDSDSRKAHATYQAIERETEQVKRLFGEDYEDLLWNLER